MGKQAASTSGGLLVLLLAIAPTNGAVAAQRVELHCTSGDAFERHDLPPDGLDISIAGDAQWLEVEESGQVVRFADHVPGEVNLSQPLRYGWRWQPVHDRDVVGIRLLDPGRTSGSIRTRLHCTASSVLDSRLQWLHQAGAMADDLDRTVAPEKLVALLAASRQLIDSAVDARTRAFALHMRAQALGANDRSLDSAVAFGEAKAAWHALGDSERELAASVGQVELLYMAGRYASVVALIPPPSQIGDNDVSYFRTRLESTRCRTQQILGRLVEAGSCYRWLLTKYLSLGELAEYAVTLENFASLLQDEGDLEGAMRLGEKALESATGSDAAMIRGRIHVMLADMALRAGNVNRSLLESDAAIVAFDSARWGVHRWQANVYLHVAGIYTQMGVYSEAYDALASAVAKLSAVDAPSRFAVAMEYFADIEEKTDNLQSALWWQRAAEQIYAGLAMSAALDAARADRVAFQIEAGDVAAAARAIAERGARFAANDSRWMLLAADLAIHRGDRESAQTQLQQLNGMPLSLPKQIRLATLRAHFDEMIGDAQQAQTGLFTAALRLKALADRIGNPELRYLLDRQIFPLRRTAFDIALRQADAAQDTSASIDTIWRWLQLSMPANEETVAERPTETVAFDRAIAQDLLATDSATKAKAESAAQRRLLSILSNQANHGRTPRSVHRVPIAAVQSGLRPGQMLIAYVDGGTRAAMLSITHAAVALRPAAAQSEISSATNELDALLQESSTPVAHIDASASRLATATLRPFSGEPAPGELLVLADGAGLLERIPWSLLAWPGAAEPLVATTPIALATIDTAPRKIEADGAQRLDVLIAAPERASARLALLPDAEFEPTLIAQSVRDRSVMTQDGTNISIDSLAAVLGRGDAWVHLTAHGSAQPNRLGYSGIWLDANAPGQTPRFLSWLDVLGLHVNADLVVLNACQLAQRGDLVAANSSFAAALSQAGARQVVASLWSVSDAAAMLWDPAFYRAIDADPDHDAAVALRMAQQRLRQSREFAHPFFWAGTQAIVRLDLSTAAAAP